MHYHQTTTNQTKINELKTIPCYKYELVKPSKGIVTVLYPDILILLNRYGHRQNEAKSLKTSPVFLTLISLIV